MKLKLSQIRFFALITAVIIVSFASGWWARENGINLRPEGTLQSPIDKTLPQRRDVDFSLFWEVWDRLEASYFDKSKIDYQKMILGAIKGMVASIGDPYTVFLPPDEQKRTQEDLGGEFEGVGLQLGFKGTQLAVIAPLEGTPAEKAGVKGGDFIVGIKDENKKLETNTVGLSLPDAVEAIRGRAGTRVTLVLTREGVEKPFEVEIVRARIEVPSIKLSFVGDNKDIAHLQLYRFGDNTNGEWDKAISSIKNPRPRQAERDGQKSKSMILDLRNNPGGYLNGAVIIASEFLPQGVVVIQEDGRKTKQEFKAAGKARLADIKLIVLVNGGSASASEIVAGALRDQDRAKIVGEKTFGKGTIQESQQLDSSGLHITTSRWLTPNGTWVNDKGGLEPDIEVGNNPDTEEDEQLERAIEELVK